MYVPRPPGLDSFFVSIAANILLFHSYLNT